MPSGSSRRERQQHRRRGQRQRGCHQAGSSVATQAPISSCRLQRTDVIRQAQQTKSKMQAPAGASKSVPTKGQPAGCWAAPHLRAPVPEEHLVAAPRRHQRAIGGAGQQLQPRHRVAAGRPGAAMGRLRRAGWRRRCLDGRSDAHRCEAPSSSGHEHESRPVC